MRFELTTSCMPYMISACKCLPFMPLYALFGRQSGLHTGYILIAHYRHTPNIKKTDARMTLKTVNNRHIQYEKYKCASLWKSSCFLRILNFLLIKFVLKNSKELEPSAIGYIIWTHKKTLSYNSLHNMSLGFA
jgi:hypothetical protein